MQDISGVGLVINLTTSVTFTTGITLSAFADDGDSINFSEIDIAGANMGLNGDLVTWSKVAPITVPINLINGTTEEQNMAILLEANRVGRGKKSAGDVITMTVVYPSGNSITLNNGRLTKGSPGSSVKAEGRMASKTYTFVFENKTEN